MSHVVTIRISDESKERLERLCQLTRSSKSSIAGDAIDEYLAGKLWMMEALEEGIEDRKQGRLVKHESILEHWEAKANA